MSFPSLSKGFLRKLGVVAVRRNHSAVKYIDAPPRSVFDIVLLRVFPSLHKLHFIQIGANDGIREDPIRQKIIDYDWTGLLVEPLPPLFEQLLKNYAGRSGLKFVNAAVDASAATRMIHYFRPGIQVPDWAHGMATFDIDRLRSTAKELGRHEEDILHLEIRTVTWEDLLAAFGSTVCDVLVVDAEGYDIPILRAAPLDRWRPRVIQFEHSCSGAGERLAFYGELLRIGYEIASDGTDTVAWLRPTEPALS